jgi:hypothetical protein
MIGWKSEVSNRENRDPGFESGVEIKGASSEVESSEVESSEGERSEVKVL